MPDDAPVRRRPPCRLRAGQARRGLPDYPPPRPPPHRRRQYGGRSLTVGSRYGFNSAGAARPAVSATLDGSGGGGAGTPGAQAGAAPNKGAYAGEMRENQPVAGYFSVVSKRKEPARYKNKPGMYFFFEIGDRTGTIDVKYWGGEDEDKTMEVYRSFSEGDVVSISGGVVRSYKGNREVNISPKGADALVRKADSYDKAELVQSGEVNIDEMVERLRGVIRSVSNQHVRAVLEAVFDEQMIAEFSAAPAAVRYHHGYRGGLLEHSLSMAAIAGAVADQHGRDLDRDILVAGCLLHDIGKTRGYKIDATIERTEAEIMRGHIPVGAGIVEDAIGRAGGIPDTVRDKIVHMVLSHHGALEKGSPVEPLFPEAMALHKIDDCDAQVKHAVLEKRAAVKAAAAAGGAAGGRLVRGDRGRGYVYIG